MPLSGLPFPDDRSASGLTENIIQGNAAVLRSTGATDSGTALVLDATGAGSGTQYAAYRFNPAGNPPDSVSVLFETAVTTGAFIGLANYTTKKWELSGPYTAVKTLAIDGGSYVSPAGNVWVAVVVPAGQRATVNAVSVRTINPDNIPPVAALTADITAGNAPLTVHFDASGSSDPDGNIIEYAWDFDGNGTYEEFSDGPLVSHVYTTPGLRSVRVRVTDAQLARSAAATLDVNVNALGNIAPTASFTAMPQGGGSPLTVNFDASASSDPDGQIVRYDWDFDGDGIWDAFDGPPQLSHAYSAGNYSARLRVTDNAGAQAASTLPININAPPVAVLTTDTPAVDKGGTVFLNASGSYDPDGSIVDYEWDLDGNGVLNEPGPEDSARGNSTAAKLMGDTPGHYLVSVRVTDNAGAKIAASLTLTVRGWLTLTVDSAGDVGSCTSLAVVNGHPAISYSDFTKGHLKYAYSSSNDGSTGWSNLTVDSTGNVGWGGYPTSLAVVNSRPAIGYCDVDTKSLKYAFSSSLDGSGGWSNLTVDNTLGAGEDASLKVVNGRPAISYACSPPATNTSTLKYAFSSAPDGSSGWSNLTVDSGGIVGVFSSLAVVNGFPAISYMDYTNENIKYAYSNMMDGSSGWSTLNVDNSGSAGEGSSLTVVAGRPAIAYNDYATNLKFAYGNTADGSGSWNNLAVDSVGYRTTYSSLAVVQGHPAISYSDDTVGCLKFAYSIEANGSGEWADQTVDNAGAVGTFTSLAEVDGRPAISYLDSTQRNLKYAVIYQ